MRLPFTAEIGIHILGMQITSIDGRASRSRPEEESNGDYCSFRLAETLHPEFFQLAQVI
jgi:hypothetical protein